MPETPRWLLANGKKDKATDELKWLRGPNYDVEEECYEIESSLGELMLHSHFLSLIKSTEKFEWFISGYVALSQTNPISKNRS